MQEKYLKYLTLESKKFVKRNKLWDILLYGSSVKGKTNVGDVDILLIFEDESLKKRTDLAHDFKEIVKQDKKIDIKTINSKELFDKDFLARQGIFIEGYSFLFNKPYTLKPNT